MRLIGAFAALFSVVALFSIDARAGGEVGNGGDAVYCPSSIPGAPATVEFYDYYEARVARGIEIDLGSQTDSVDTKIELALSRLRRLSPARADLYASWVARFSADSGFVSGVTLNPIPDVGEGWVPAGCSLKQLAIQRDPNLPGDKRYTVDQDLWDLLDNTSKAGLILHEVILREAVHAPNLQSDSVNSRYLNAEISSKALESMNLRDYISLIQLIGFETADEDGVLIVVNPKEGDNVGDPWFFPKFWDDNTIKQAKLSRGSTYTVQGMTFSLYGTDPIIGGAVDFYPTGQLVAFSGEATDSQSMNQPRTIHSKDGRVALDVIYGGIYFAFYPSGEFQRITAIGSGPGDQVLVRTPGWQAYLAAPLHAGQSEGADLSFHENGMPASAEIACSTKFPTAHGGTKAFPAWTKLGFDDSGNVISATPDPQAGGIAAVCP